MKIETIEIAGLAGALTALRLSFGKEERSYISADHQLDMDVINKGQKRFVTSVVIGVEPKDLTLMTTLVKKGDEHAKVVRGIIVWAKITAPVYWWCEEETVDIDKAKKAFNKVCGWLSHYSVLMK